ncbi:MAG: sulfatase-like hydrolase/transferase, partial [Candidatus Aminicenantes bacterium]|nr:sulfatase-like hydrolase/transferase [Candidatus Aminicenantes bacterium]
YNDEGNDEELFMNSNTLERNAAVVTELARDWIASQNGRWFCWLHIFDPHDPYEPPEPYRTQYAADLYSGEVAYVDAQLGRLFEDMEQRGLLDTTVIVVTSDHGEALGEKGERTHGFFAYNNTIHIPLFLYYPGVEPVTVTESVCHADIFPTISSLVDITVPEHIQGESLLPIAGGAKRQNSRIFFESMAPHNGMDAAPLIGYIEGDTKFFDLPTKEVYDISSDYFEENNLAHTAEIPAMVKNMTQLNSRLKGRGTKQDLKGKNAEILPYLRSLGYVSATPSKKKKYGVGDDPKALHPLILQMRKMIGEAQTGDFDSALKKIQTVLRIRPTYVSAYVSLAKLYYGRNRIEEAITTLEEGLNRNPGNIILSGDMGIMLFLAKRYTEAIKVLEDCTSRARFNPEYFNYLGLVHMNLGRFEPAKKAFESAISIDSSIGAVYNNLGYLHLMHYVQTGNKEELNLSLENFNKGLTFDPDRPSLLKGKAKAISYMNSDGN